MSAETVVKGMNQQRVEWGNDQESSYDDVIATIETGLRESDIQAKALQQKLESMGEPEAYIKYRLNPYAIQIDLLTGLLLTAKQLQRDGWTPEL